MDWQNFDGRPEPDQDAVFSRLFLVEFERTSGGPNFVAVCRAYRPILGGGGLQSMMVGFTYDSAEDVLASMYRPVRWQEVPKPMALN